MNENKIFVWPSKDCIQAFGKWLLIVLSVFLSIYYFCNTYASAQPHQYHMYADWELSIPLVPQMIIVYMSYILVFALIPFIFKTPDAIRGLAYSMIVTTGIAGIIFITFPGHLGYERPAVVEGYQFFYQLLYKIDQPHNLYPSLHVAFASLGALSIIHQTNVRWFHLVVKIWLIAVCASVVLVHQHHIFDIILGFPLAVAVHRYVYLKVVGLPYAQREEGLAKVEVRD